jgi:diguanylate cyclase (GGDEF)-like protein
MKNPNAAFVMILCAGLFGRAAVAGTSPPTPLDSLAAVHALSNAEAGKGLAVAFPATVTYYKKGDVDLFVQDGDFAIYVETTKDQHLTAGDRVIVRGTTRASFRPEVKGDNVTFRRHGAPPVASPASFRQLIRAELDCRRVTLHAVVRSANNVMDGGLPSVYLQLLMDGGSTDAEVLDADLANLSDLLDAEVEITGAVAGRFDSRVQMTGILLEVNSLSDLKVLARPLTLSGSLPITPLDEILKTYDVQDRTKRVRVRGTITYYEPGSAVVLQDGDKGLWIMTQFEKPLEIGDRASASGFPDVRNGSLTLTRANIQSEGVSSPIAPLVTSAEELATGEHAFDLVSVRGRLLIAMREAAQDEYFVLSNGHLISAVYRHPERGMNVELPPIQQVPLGSFVRMTGICILDNGDRFLGSAAFEVLLRSSNDITVIGSPSLLNVHNLLLVVGLLFVVVIGIGAWGWLTERRARQQTAKAAILEQIRSRILVDMNRGSPLPEILRQITDLVSFRLHGASCWCNLSDGAQFGNRPPYLRGVRVLHTEIAGRSGTAHGTISAAVKAVGQAEKDGTSTLSVAAELATLAIESRRLYADLLHRSEFDLLTDIHNRFSFERRLDSSIEEAATNIKAFGLIYIDLDAFKQINDLYGHQVGDSYLQNIVMRMKRQIRPTDLLARLGGDEFAVLVESADNGNALEEIAYRINRCFEDPFAIEGLNLNGSASTGIAMFPDDGLTRDDLLNAADAAMYLAKRSKRRIEAV